MAQTAVLTHLLYHQVVLFVLKSSSLRFYSYLNHQVVLEVYSYLIIFKIQLKTSVARMSDYKNKVYYSTDGEQR